MTKTRVLSAVALAGMIVIPFIVLNASVERSDVHRFLKTRGALFDRLHAHAVSLPAGYEQVHRQPPAKRWPPEEHIRSVVGEGKLWYSDSSASYDIRLTGKAAERDADEAVMELIEHFSSGFEEIGLVSSQSGGPAMIAAQRAGHFQSWWSADHAFIVTLTAIVDADSDTAFVTRFVHERFE